MLVCTRYNEATCVPRTRSHLSPRLGGRSRHPCPMRIAHDEIAPHDFLALSFSSWDRLAYSVYLLPPLPLFLLEPKNAFPELRSNRLTSMGSCASFSAADGSFWFSYLCSSVDRVKGLGGVAILIYGPLKWRNSRITSREVSRIESRESDL